jgi:hypothetical protein
MNRSLTHLLTYCCIVLCALVVLRNIASAQTPKGYAPKTVEGWQLYIDPLLPIADSSPYPELISILQLRLREINLTLPSAALAELRKVPIFLELSDTTDTKDPIMTYHATKEWMISHHLNAEKARSIEISNAQHYINWEKAMPASLLLNGVAWAYYDRVLTYENADIKVAYRNAIQGHLYDTVVNIIGLRSRSVALQDERNYFAAMTAAYFGVATFYPFIRAELFAEDRPSFMLMRKLWRIP